MKDMPGGTWIVLEGRANKEGVDLVTLGYKYNKKKVITFVFTKGARSSAPGKPYEARFPDKYGNVCIQHVGCPEIVWTYFASYRLSRTSELSRPHGPPRVPRPLTP